MRAPARTIGGMKETFSADDTHVSAAGGSQAVTSPGMSIRSTVLPRVEWEGPDPRVSPTQRHRFEELGLLGEGGMGEVVLAKDHDIEREVALKRLPANCDLGRVLRFVEEIRTVGQLEHPNIVPVHDVGVDATGRYYFVMKHLRGETLESIIARLAAGDAAAHARYTMQVRMQIFLSILNAMAYAHKQGFIHRDLKPANIMIGPFGEVTVMDWGLAKRIRAPERNHGDGDTHVSGPRDGTALQTQLGMVMGTPLYMSPEQASGLNDTLDERSDLYSLAVILHEFLNLTHYLAGKKDVKAVMLGVVQDKPPLHVVNNKGAEYQVPAELDWYTAKGFEKEPAKRYQSVDEMQQELQRIIRGECRMQCQRTVIKRGLFEITRLVDAHPQLVIIGMGVVGTVLLAALVKSVMTLF